MTCSTLPLLIALAASTALAQKPSLALQIEGTPPSATRIDPAPEESASSPASAAARKLPKTGNPAGARRQQADRRFLAQRGIRLEPQAATSSRPTAALADKLRPARAQQRLLLSAASHIHPDASTPGTWQSLGPAQVETSAYGAVTGRITSLAADPNNSTGNTLYVGSTGGGVWKSTNAAGPAANVTFTPLTDDLPAFSNALGSLSIGALTVQPTSSSVVLAGTGDPNNALDSYYGVGILRSTDGGLSWTLIHGSKDARQGGLQNYSFIGNGFSGFAWSSLNPSLVVAAVSQSAEGMLVNAGSQQGMESGLFYSTDAGQTWYLGVIEDDSTHVVQSPSIAGSLPGNPATSVLWNPVRQRFYAAVRYHGYYESLDGITWTRLTNQPGPNLSTSACPTNPGGVGQTSCPIFRGVLAVQPLTGDLFALTTSTPSNAGPGNLDQGLFQDKCSPSGLPVSSCASNTVTFASQINSDALEIGNGDTTIPLADYNLTLSAVASQQDTILFAGTEDIYRCSLADSCAWRNTTNIQTCAAAAVAPSQHAAEATFGANGLIYFANDGGLWRSTDTVAQTGSVCASSDASHFQNLNSAIGSLAEITHFSISPNSPSTLLAGIGGFGTVATTTGQGAWQQLVTGEGSYTAIDPANAQNWYTEAGSGVDILRCTAGSNCNAAGFGSTPVIGSGQVEGDADYFIDAAPWVLDPLNSANLLLGTCRVWRGPAIGGSTWNNASLLSPMLDGNQQPFCNGNAQLRSIAAGLDVSAPVGSEQMYAGMAGLGDGGSATAGHVFTSTVPAGGGQTTWTDLWRSPVTNSSSNPQFNEGEFAVSSIAVDPHDSTGKTIYVTMQGFSGNGISEGEVYGSTDGGAHWLNLTNSLPLAPANSIVVDPNVPSVLYVALDTGVYYTQNVAACADQAQTCWAVFGSGLPNAPVTSLQLYSAGGSSMLEASTYGRGIWALALLTAPAQGTLSPANYTFANQQVNTSSDPTAFTVTNTGASAMSIAQIATTADYPETNNCGGSLAAFSSCSIQVTFTPTLAGDRAGSLTVFANVAGGRLTSTLDGMGLAPGMITVTPGSLSFSPTVQGSSSSAQSINIQNTGGIAVELLALSATTDYQISADTCGSSLEPGASCSASITFTPSAVGDRPGHLAIPSNLPISPTLVPLDGSGVSPPALTLSPASLSFPGTAQGSLSVAQSITVTNTGGAAAQLQAPTVSGDYQIASGTCGSTLPPGAICSLQIDFAPVALGSRPGLLTIVANVFGGQVTASLNGTGLTPAALALNPASLIFPSTTQGVPSAALSLHLTSTGGVAVQLGTPSTTGDYALSSNGCVSSLAPGTGCTLQITFTPTTTGDRQGILTVPANVAGGAVTVLLDGTGISPPSISLNPTSLTFGATAVGTVSAAQSIALTNLGGTAAQIVQPSATGDFAVSSNTCGSTINPGTTCTLQVTFDPSAAGSRTGLLTLSGLNFSITRVSSSKANLRALLSVDSGSNPVTVSLSGTGVSPPVVTFNPSPATFGPTVSGAASAPQSITATNTGSIPVQLQMPSISGNFYIGQTNCGSILAAGAGCSVQVAFHPAATGPLSGTLILSGSMAAGQVTDSLSGTGLPPGALSMTPSTLSYSQVVGSTSAQETITIQNNGAATLTLPPASITGSNASDYAIASNNCGTLVTGSSCSINVTFHPTAAGQRTAQVQQADGLVGDQPTVVTLAGTGLNPGSVAFLPPASADFGAVVESTTSSPASLVARNSGDVAVHLLSATSAGDFASSNGCPSTLGPGSSCTVTVTFTPTGAGTRTGTLTLTSDASNSPASAPLTGVGVTPGNIIITPSLRAFASTVVGAPPATGTLNVANTGGAAVQLGARILTGDYSVSSEGCPASLAPNGSCTELIAFSPTAPGDRTGTFQFAGSPSVANLDGTGIAPGALTIAPSPLNFTPVILGSSSSLQVTVTNSGGVAVQLGSSIAQGDYSIQANACQGSLAPQTSCLLQIAFSPTAAGDRQGLLTVTGNIQGGSRTAALDGTGVLPGQLSFSPPLLSFGTTVQGTASAPQMLTIANTGGASLTLQPPVISPGYHISQNNCGSVLAAGNQCTVGITFAPTALGDQPGLITVSAPGAQPRNSNLDGYGVAPAHLLFAPAAILFSSVEVGKSSASQSVTLSNTGGVPADLLAPVLAGDYAILADDCGASLATHTTCTLQVTFNPSAAGNRTGSLTVATADSSSRATLSLEGTGTPPPVLVLTPLALTFAATGQGATTAALNITVANVGSQAVTLQQPTVTGDFALSAFLCPGPSLSPSYECTLSITFTPTSGGQRSGLLTVSDGTETHTATLTGTGLSPATDTLSRTSLTFGPQVFGTSSSPQSVTMTNSGGSTLGSIATQTVGPFNATDNCGTILGGSLSCSIAVTFAPSGAGSQTGQLLISDAQRTQTVTLNGQGVLPPQAVATPLALDFGGYAVGVPSPVQLVTMTNNGKTSLTGFAAVLGTPSFSVATNTCGSTVPAGASCTLGITFTPSQPGNDVDQLTLSSPSLNGTLTVALSGSGEDFQLSTSGSTSDLITNGQTATYKLVISPVGISAGVLTLSCSGAPANSSCTINPSALTVSGGATGSITVSIVTGLSSNARGRPGSLASRLPWRSGAVLALLLPCLLLRGHPRRPFLVLLLAAALVCAPTACGVHASGGSSAKSGPAASGTTPPGKYSILVMASFPGAQRTVTLTLTVE